MIERPVYTLSVYGISSHRGFLPAQVPLRRLSDPYYEPWEIVMQRLPNMIKTATLRSAVLELPMFDTTLLQSEAEWMRAYVIFSFLTHAHIWSGTKPSEHLPPQLTVPFLVIADHFALPTTATYAGLSLWNWRPSHVAADISDPENVQINHTFTGTTDEAWFYSISVSIEARAAAMIPTLLECFEAIKSEDETVVIRCLGDLSRCITEMGNILDRMHERCDPKVFYYQIRPFLAGSKGMASAGLANGIFYDEGNGNGQWRQYSGGSNAQSSVIQLLDIVLGVEHTATGQVSANADLADRRIKPNYLLEMRNYMPGPHRHFLTYISSITNIRNYAKQERPGSDVRALFEAAVLSLTTFRDKHIRMVSRYILAPSMQADRKPGNKPLNIASASSRYENGDRSFSLSGTGGTTLMPFLKQTRDETKAALAFDGFA